MGDLVAKNNNKNNFKSKKKIDHTIIVNQRKNLRNQVSHSQCKTI